MVGHAVHAADTLVCGRALRRLLADDDPWADDEEFVAEVVVAAYEKRRAQTEIINAMPLYPTEKLLWDENQVPNVQYTGAAPRAAQSGRGRVRVPQRVHQGLPWS